MTYKPGDHYPDWQKLTPLPKWKTAEELRYEVGDLFVVVGIGNANTWCIGEIIELLNDDDSPTPWFTNPRKPTKEAWCCSFFNLAPLPAPHAPNRITMSNLIAKFRTLTASKEEKLLLEHGIENPLGTPTTDGIALLNEIMYAENREKVKAAVVKIAEEGKE